MIMFRSGLLLRAGDIDMPVQKCECDRSVPTRWPGLFARCTLCGRPRDRRLKRLTQVLEVLALVAWLAGSLHVLL